ncbi:MAG: hypothetical protein ACPHUF_15275 [Gammaproteobacteria bacterium]
MNAVAGRVNHADFVRGNSSGGADNRGGQSAVTLTLNLEGYENAALLFDFDDFVRGDSTGFRIVSAELSAPGGGLSLVSPTSSGSGFYQPASDGLFRSAMFNLSTYDGQLVTLRLGRGSAQAAADHNTININSISVDVLAANDPAENAVAIPEPRTAALVLTGLMLLAIAKTRRRLRLLPAG